MRNAFEEWWFRTTGLHTEFPKDHMETGEISFKAGWEAHAAITANSRTAEREAAEQAARQIERAALKRKFLALASTAFLAGQDEEAKMYRSLADLHFSS